MPGVNIDDARGESTETGWVSRYSKTGWAILRQTSHERYDSYIEKFPSLGPISRIFFILFGEVDDLNYALDGYPLIA